MTRPFGKQRCIGNHRFIFPTWVEQAGQNSLLGELATDERERTWDDGRSQDGDGVKGKIIGRDEDEAIIVRQLSVQGFNQLRAAKGTGADDDDVLHDGGGSGKQVVQDSSRMLGIKSYLIVQPPLTHRPNRDRTSSIIGSITPNFAPNYSSGG